MTGNDHGRCQFGWLPVDPFIEQRSRRRTILPGEQSDQFNAGLGVLFFL